MVSMTPGSCSYDEQGLVAALLPLDRVRQATFAAACAERLMPSYQAFHDKTGQGDPATLRSLLDGVWAHLSRGRGLVVEGYAERLEALIPGESDAWSVESGLAQNAAGSVGYAIDTALEGGPQNAAWAARQVYEATDLWVRTRDNVDFNVAGADAKVLEDPVVQAELARQRRDLDELVRIDGEELPELVTRVRTRATTEARRLFTDMG